MNPPAHITKSIIILIALSEISILLIQNAQTQLNDIITKTPAESDVIRL